VTNESLPRTLDKHEGEASPITMATPGGEVIELPQIYTCRYLATDVLGCGRTVPVRIGMEPPLIPLPYELEVVETLLPGYSMILAEWPNLSPEYWRRLERTGVDRIASELAAISARHDGKPVALLDYEDLVKGQRSPRIIAAAFLEEKLGITVPELLDSGETLHFTELPKQVQPKRPKVGVEECAKWPLEHSDIEAWMKRVPWKFAKTAANNPHEYSLRKYQDEQMFFLVLLHLRENGYQQWYGGQVYSVYDVGEYFIWSMQAATLATILINRKFHDPEKQARLAEEQTGKSCEELGLNIARGEASEYQAVEPELFDTKEDT
jgi:hypothetical protein